MSETNFNQRPFGSTEFADNPESRCPVLLLLDNSHSMNGQPLKELNAGLQLLRDELFGDSLASKRVDIAVLTFGPVKVESDFVSVQHFYPPVLTAAGDTPMGTAIESGLQLLRQRKDVYRQNGISYYRPWVFMITDGTPTDTVTRAADLVREGEAAKSFMFLPVGVEGANFDVLRQISVREPLKLKGLQFRELFLWLSASLSAVSKSQVGDTTPLENPTGPNGWAVAG